MPLRDIKTSETKTKKGLLDQLMFYKLGNDAVASSCVMASPVVGFLENKVLHKNLNPLQFGKPLPNDASKPREANNPASSQEAEASPSKKHQKAWRILRDTWPLDSLA